MHKVDIIIIGGGITGLWLLNLLSRDGRSVLLLEKEALGAGQTLQSQGILHGGTKYALQGKLNPAATSIADMPALWGACLQGKGDIDLANVKVLSNYHFLFSSGVMLGNLKNLISSHALTKGQYLNDKQHYPLIFQHPDFKGSLCAISETVLDVPSLISNLARPHKERILKTDDNTTYDFTPGGSLSAINIQAKRQSHSICANKYILAAGEGNEAILSKVNGAPSMQRRPLHMVSIAFKLFDPHKVLFAHCLGKGSKPLFTITTHQAADGKMIWYIGGDIAETGIHRDKKRQISYTISLLQHHFPWIDFDNVKGSSFIINRAEHDEGQGMKPNSYHVSSLHNMLITWPTKLVLVPGLSRDILQRLTHEQSINSGTDLMLSPMQKAVMSVPKWSHYA